MANQDAVRLDIKDTIATVLLNRPEALNAFDLDVFLGLQKTAQAIKENSEVRVVIITGAGDKAFSAGLDLKMVASGSGPTEIVTSYRQGYDSLYNLKMIFTMYEELATPVIAAINGFANAQNSGALATWLDNNYKKVAGDVDPDRKIYSFSKTGVSI